MNLWNEIFSSKYENEEIIGTLGEIYVQRACLPHKVF